jgi:hypothetical protein
MLEAPTLDTKRLLLRGYKAGDENDIFRFGSDTLTTRFMLWPKHKTIEDSKRAFNFFHSGYQNDSEIFDWDLVETRRQVHREYRVSKPAKADPLGLLDVV